MALLPFSQSDNVLGLLADSSVFREHKPRYGPRFQIKLYTTSLPVFRRVAKTSDQVQL